MCGDGKKKARLLLPLYHSKSSLACELAWLTQSCGPSLLAWLTQSCGPSLLAWLTQSCGPSLLAWLTQSCGPSLLLLCVFGSGWAKCLEYHERSDTTALVTVLTKKNAGSYMTGHSPPPRSTGQIRWAPRLTAAVHSSSKARQPPQYSYE